MEVNITINNGSSDYVMDDYVLESWKGSLAVRVESERPGEPGVVTMDKISCEFKESDTSSLFTPAALAAAKAAGTWYNVTVGVDFGSGTRTLMRGVVDYDSVVYTQDETVTFDVFDRLLLLKLMPKSLVRAEDNYSDAGFKFLISNGGLLDNQFYVVKYNIGSGFEADFHAADFAEYGCTFNLNGNYYFITKVEAILYNGADALKITCHNDWQETEESLYVFTLQWWTHTIYGQDYNNYSGGVVTSFDAYAIMLDVMDTVFSGVTKDVTGLSTTDFPASLDHFWGMGIGDALYDIFSLHPHDALKNIIRGMRCYMYFKPDNKLYLSDWPNVSPGADIYLYSDSTSSPILSWNKRFNWEKRVDMVHVEADFSDDIDEADYPNEYSSNNAETMNVKVFKPYDSNLSETAEDLWEFYGKRHLAATVKLPLDDALAQILSILMTVDLDGEDYFLVGYTLDLQEETVDMELVSYTRWEY